MNLELRFPVGVQPIIHQSDGGAGFLPSLPSTLSYGRYVPCYTSVSSSTSIVSRVYALCDKSRHDAATAPPSITVFRLEADTSQPTLNKPESRRGTRLWVDILRKYRQTEKNAPAIALIQSWLREAETVDDEETRDLQETKALLDAHRPSYRKLFP